jgi:hypothetical protein
MPDLLAELTGAKPVSPSARESAAMASATIPDNAAGLVDDQGRPFSPLIHEVDQAGQAVIRRNGKLRCKRGIHYRRGLRLMKQGGINGPDNGGGVGSGVPDDDGKPDGSGGQPDQGPGEPAPGGLGGADAGGPAVAAPGPAAGPSRARLPGNGRPDGPRCR